MVTIGQDRTHTLTTITVTVVRHIVMAMDITTPILTRLGVTVPNGIHQVGTIQTTGPATLTIEAGTGNILGTNVKSTI